MIPENMPPKTHTRNHSNTRPTCNCLKHTRISNTRPPYLPPVSALLARLSEIHSQDPTAKSVVFSTWGRLLRLVGEALKDNGIECAAMMGEC